MNTEKLVKSLSYNEKYELLQLLKMEFENGILIKDIVKNYDITRRTANILKTYSDFYGIEYVNQIEFDKLRRMRNCGKYVMDEVIRLLTNLKIR